MKIYDFSKYLERLEATPKRLEITSILAELIKNLDEEEIDKGIYLSLGTLKAPFDSEKFNIAEKMMIRSVENAFGISGVEQEYKKEGDLGDVVYKLNVARNDQKYDILQVYTTLLDTAKLEGSGSQEAKVKKLGTLLKELDKLSAKFITRIVLGTTRLGFTELTVVDALSQVLNNDKLLKAQIEAKYFIHPDIGLIAKKIKEKGLAGLNNIKIETGVPVLSQKAQRLGGITEIMEKLSYVWAEFKFDGTRVQLHMDRNKSGSLHLDESNGSIALFDNETKDDILIKTFTRNLEDNSHQYPDIVQAAKEQIQADSVILDCEAIGYDRKTGNFLPFQETMQRKRLYSVKEMSNEIPLKLFAFDIIYLNGEALIDKPLKERHEILKRVIKDGDTIKVAEHVATDSTIDLKKYYELSKKHNLEGLIVKKPEGTYQAGARSYSWIKLKKADEKLLDDSVDVVVLGYYVGRGERSKFGVGGFLVGIYDEKEKVFKTLSKVGTGLKDEDWEYFKKEADKHKINEIPSNVLMHKIYKPDVILNPKLVVEIGADEVSKSKTHTAGFALRFPRLLFFRTDKNPMDATNLEEIQQLYSLQKRGKL